LSVTDVRELLAGAQAAEARGDKGEAISLLRRAAEVYRDAQNPGRALKMLRHIRRLEGFDEDFEDVAAMVSQLPDAAPQLEDPEPEVARPRGRMIEERGPALASPELDAWCSFCCRPKREVGPLVAGPTGTFICAACTGKAGAFLAAPLPADTKWETVSTRTATVLSHQHEAMRAISREDSKIALLLGPAGAGRTTLLSALGDPSVAKLDLDAPLSSLPNARRVVIAVRAQPPPPPLVIAGRPVYDTATLVTAVGGLVPEETLARVDAVGVLPAFDASTLRELAEALGVKDSVEQLVSLALKAAKPALELRALIARLAP
jgi:hypothetical protein